MGWKLTFDGKRRPISVEDRNAEIAQARAQDEVPLSVWEEGTGTVVEADDLTLIEFSELVESTGVGWQVIYDTACYDDIPKFMKVVEICAKHAGVAPPTPGDMREFMNLYRDGWEWVQPIQDKSYTDGFPQTPGEPESGSTSTSPGDTDGPQTLSSDSPSEGS